MGDEILVLILKYKSHVNQILRLQMELFGTFFYYKSLVLLMLKALCLASKADRNQFNSGALEEG